MTQSIDDLYTIAEVSLSFKNKYKISERPQVTCSKDAYQILIRSWDQNKIDFVEQAKVLLLNRSNRVLGISEVSSGGVSGTVVDPKVVFVTALKANASSIILAHNHPSGSLKASDQDKMLTEKFTHGGKLLDVRLTDHIIITSEGYYSFGDDEIYKADSFTPY